MRKRITAQTMARSRRAPTIWLREKRICITTQQVKYSQTENRLDLQFKAGKYRGGNFITVA